MKISDFFSGADGFTTSTINVTLLAFLCLGLSTIIGIQSFAGSAQKIQKWASYGLFGIGSILGFVGFLGVLFYSNTQQHPVIFTVALAAGYVSALATVQMNTVRSVDSLWK